MSTTTLTEIRESELDEVGAGSTRVAFVGLFVAVQTNLSAQTSLNLLSAGTGNQYVAQYNNASIN